MSMRQLAPGLQEVHNAQAWSKIGQLQNTGHYIAIHGLYAMVLPCDCKLGENVTENARCGDIQR